MVGLTVSEAVQGMRALPCMAVAAVQLKQVRRQLLGNTQLRTLPMAVKLMSVWQPAERTVNGVCLYAAASCCCRC